MFPGQGAQFVGMCESVCNDVPAAKALFDEASEILGYDLLQVCTEGPKEKLDSTVISQPAIFVASMAAVEKLKHESGQEALDAATCALGLSLGEYSALCFADAISFADGVKITKARGEAMQAAVPQTLLSTHKTQHAGPQDQDHSARYIDGARQRASSDRLRTSRSHGLA